MNRREFLKTAGSAALMTAAGGCATSSRFVAQGEIRAMLMHLGWNMWSDIPVTSWGPYKGEELSCICAADHVRTDFGVWRRVTGQMAADGYNLIVIDLGEAMVYPSHPELAAKGALDPDAMRRELGRLRGLGLEPIPKLNFSTAHDTWLKDYGRMVSTERYYQVCRDVIRDVAEVFDAPRFIHLGYDEETAGHQSRYAFAVVRQGELWWHDFLWFAETARQAGMRPWIWSDFIWHHRDEFLKRMPRDVLQSNWYYGAEFDYAKMKNDFTRLRVRAYEDMDKAGFDQVPCGSNWDCAESLPNTVAFARRTLSPERVKGFQNAPWFFPNPVREQKLLEACRIGGRIWGGKK